MFRASVYAPFLRLHSLVQLLLHFRSFPFISIFLFSLFLSRINREAVVESFVFNNMAFAVFILCERLNRDLHTIHYRRCSAAAAAAAVSDVDADVEVIYQRSSGVRRSAQQFMCYATVFIRAKTNCAALIHKIVSPPSTDRRKTKAHNPSVDGSRTERRKKSIE